MPAAVIGAAGMAASAGAAAAAVGAIATAGTAALTVGSIASIATFVGSTLTVVGAVTGDKNLLNVGSVLGVAGGVTSVAANSLKLFGESQTLAAAAEAGKAAEAGIGIKLTSPATTSASILKDASGTAVDTSTAVNAGIDTSISTPGLDFANKFNDKIGSAFNTSTKAASSATGGSTSGLLSTATPATNAANTSAMAGVKLSEANAPSFFADTNKIINNVAAPAVQAPTSDGSILGKITDFVTDEKNAKILEGVGAAGNALASYNDNQSKDNYRRGLIAAENRNLALKEQIYADYKKNASAAADLYAYKYGRS